MVRWEEELRNCLKFVQSPLMNTEVIFIANAGYEGDPMGNLKDLSQMVREDVSGDFVSVILTLVTYK